jgi:predicted NBD/HSP70 family sugar kinase
MFDFHGHELDRRYLDIGAGADAAGAFSWMQSQVEEMVTDPSNVVGVGIGIAAPVKSASSSPLHDTFAMPDWIGRDPAHELRERLGWDCPFEVDNDANLGGVAELHWGAARGLSDAVFVKWTWGIGAGLIMGGEVQRGQGTAGELGHVNVELEEPDRKSPPPRCPTCGRHCLQSVASMPALLADAGIQGAYDRSRLHPAVEELLRTIRSGDPGPKRSLDRACRYLGQALGTVITLLSPQAVIIGGDLAAESYDLFAPELLAAMRDNSRGSAFRDVALRAGQQTGRASLLGAATWMLDEHLLDYLMRRAATRKKDA